MKNPVQFVSPLAGRLFNALLGDYRWAQEPGEPLTLSYSFYAEDSPVHVDLQNGYSRSDPQFDWPFRPGFAGFTEPQKDNARRIFEEVENFLKVRFVEVADSLNADFRLGRTNLERDEADGLSFVLSPEYLPFRLNPEQFHDAAPLSVDIWINTELPSRFFHEVLLHEIGHALGLTHPFENGFEELHPVDNAVLDGELDYLRYSAMAYDYYPDSVHERELVRESPALTFMPLDIEALQFLYGAAEDADNDLYVLRERRSDPELEAMIRAYDSHSVHDYYNAYVTIVDSGGHNALLIAVDGDLHIDLRPGAWSNTGGGLATTTWQDDNLYLAPETVLEELLLTGTGRHTVVIGEQDFGANKFFDRGAHLLLREVDGGERLLIEGADELVFADVTLPADNWRKAAAEWNEALLLDPQGPLYQSGIDGGLEGEADDVPPLEAQLYRLYFGGLGRAPDKGGFAWWLERLDTGVFGLGEVSARFVDSDEFERLADANADQVISDNEFLDHMYLNVFGREPDAGGYAWWLEQLQSGEFTHPLSFAHMVQSDEFVLLTAATVSDLLLV